MREVAHFLQNEAISRQATDGADSFARSAFNRYYYAVFLCVREKLSSIDPDWGKMPHNSYPEKITSILSKEIRTIEKKAKRIGDARLASECGRAKSFAWNLADLMKKAYAIRKVADYDPEVLVDFKVAERFALSGVEITEAHNWPTRAELWAGTIVDVLSQADA